MGQYNIVKQHGTNILGYFEKENKKCYVLPKISIGKQAIDYIPPDSNNPVESLFGDPKILEKKEQKEVVKTLFLNIFKLNEENPLLSCIGRFFATPFKQQITKISGHFPILNVFGTKGSGKTTLISQFLKMFSALSPFFVTL